MLPKAEGGTTEEVEVEAVGAEGLVPKGDGAADAVANAEGAGFPKADEDSDPKAEDEDEEAPKADEPPKAEDDARG